MSHEFQPTLENETMDKDKPSNIGSHENIKDEVEGIVSVKSDDNLKLEQSGK